MPLDLSCSNEEKVLVTVTPTTAGGRPAQLDGDVRVTVTSGEGSFAMVSPTSFHVVSGDNPGGTTYLVEGDADLGAGQVLIQDTIALNVIGANASNLGMTAGAPEPR